MRVERGSLPGFRLGVPAAGRAQAWCWGHFRHGGLQDRVSFARGERWPGGAVVAIFGVGVGYADAVPVSELLTERLAVPGRAA